MGEGATDVIQYGALLVWPNTATYDGVVIPLHTSELRLLRVLVASKGRVVSRDDLHRLCWNRQTKRRLVDVVVCRLRPKLEADTHLTIATERRAGYRITERPNLGFKVLVVESDISLQRAYQRMFGAMPIELAGTLAVAQKLVNRRDYSAYLIELSLPDGCGSKLIPLIQQRDPRAPIMIVTARHDQDAIDLSAKYGVSFSRKPPNFTWLKDFVRRASVPLRARTG
jgi:DNA-binding response OmpR family regulator